MSSVTEPVVILLPYGKKSQLKTLERGIARLLRLVQIESILVPLQMCLMEPARWDCVKPHGIDRRCCCKNMRAQQVCDGGTVLWVPWFSSLMRFQACSSNTFFSTSTYAWKIGFNRCLIFKWIISQGLYCFIGCMWF